MKILRHLAVVVAAAAVGLAVGFTLRGKPTPAVAAPDRGPDAEVESTGAKRKSIQFSKKLPAIRANDDSPLATQLERDLSMSSGVTRWLYWLEAIEKATTRDFPRLARLANGNSTITRLVAARWVELDPRHLFDTLVSSAGQGGGFPAGELSSVLFEEWPKRDPEAVIAALNGSENFGLRASWRMTVAGRFFDRDVERGLRLFSEWHIENYGPRMTGVAKWAAANPRHAAEFALANPAGYASRLIMETIGKEWAKREPAEAVQFAASQRGELGAALAESALKTWASRDLQSAFEWLAGADAMTRNRLSPPLVESWARQDAGAALAWCEANLHGSTLAQAVGGVLKGAASTDVVAAAELVNGLKPSPARAEAAAAVALKWFPESNSGKTQRVAPETIAWIASLDADSVRRILTQHQWRWSESDPESLAEFLISSRSDQIPTHTYTSLARTMARRNPGQAIEWSNRLPQEQRISTGGEAFVEWQRSQGELAWEWLKNLPPTDDRREAFFRRAIQSLAFESHAPEQIASLAAEERAAARRVIGEMTLPAERKNSLLNALK